MPLEPGTTLGFYSVTAKIGEGGLGQVYQATDTKLDRDVALKVLPPAFTARAVWTISVTKTIPTGWPASSAKPRCWPA